MGGGPQAGHAARRTPGGVALARLCSCLGRVHCSLRTLGPPGSGSGKRPGCAGAAASAHLCQPRAFPERQAAFLTAAARGCSARSDRTTRPGSARLSSGGVYSAVAPTLWPLGPQRAAPGSARAGGGCYARNVRVSGSPSGSKRTTNNLSAHRPLQSYASSRSLLLAPAFLGEAALRAGSRASPRAPFLRRPGPSRTRWAPPHSAPRPAPRLPHSRHDLLSELPGTN